MWWFLTKGMQATQCLSCLASSVEIEYSTSLWLGCFPAFPDRPLNEIKRRGALRPGVRPMFVCPCVFISLFRLSAWLKNTDVSFKRKELNRRSGPIPSHAPTWSTTGKTISIGKRSLWAVEIKYRDGFGHGHYGTRAISIHVVQINGKYEPYRGAMLLNSIRADLPNLWHPCFPTPYFSYQY